MMKGSSTPTKSSGIAEGGILKVKRNPLMQREMQNIQRALTLNWRRHEIEKRLLESLCDGGDECCFDDAVGDDASAGGNVENVHNDQKKGSASNRKECQNGHGKKSGKNKKKKKNVERFDTCPMLKKYLE